jgi:hypothetical protein
VPGRPPKVGRTTGRRVVAPGAAQASHTEQQVLVAALDEHLDLVDAGPPTRPPGARHAALSQLAGDAGDAASGQPLREHPPHVRRRHRVRGRDCN